MQRFGTVGIADLGRGAWLVIEAFDLCRHIEEALRAQEESGPRAKRSADEPKVFCKLRSMALGSEVEVHSATFGIEARGDGYALDQCRLPTAVLAYEDRRARIERKRADSLKCREAKRVRLPLEFRPGDLDAADEGLRRG